MSHHPTADAPKLADRLSIVVDEQARPGRVLAALLTLLKGRRERERRSRGRPVGVGAN